MSTEEYHVTEGNIFEDLGLEEIEELTVRSDLLSEMNQLIQGSKLTQKEISKILGITPPKVSMLTNGKLSAFSTDSLMKYLRLLGCSIVIAVKKGSPLTSRVKRGHMTVKKDRCKKRKARKKSRARA